MVALADGPAPLDNFATFHLQGHWDADGTAMIAAICQAIGRSVPVLPFPWLLVQAAAPFVPLFRELAELRYLWREPLHLSNDHLVRVLGREPLTPLGDAVRATLAGLGCLPGGQGISPSRSAA
jgi:nucleoside-diphosphate-sugar epimerase